MLLLVAGAKVVSQCYSSTTYSFLSLYCGNEHVIRIERALHGIHSNARIVHCGRIQGDCAMNTLRHYDWRSCEGQRACVLSIKPLEVIRCSNDTHEWLNESEAGNGKPEVGQEMSTSGHQQYLQVHYTCVHGNQHDDRFHIHN